MGRRRLSVTSRGAAERTRRRTPKPPRHPARRGPARVRTRRAPGRAPSQHRASRLRQEPKLPSFHEQSKRAEVALCSRRGQHVVSDPAGQASTVSVRGSHRNDPQWVRSLTHPRRKSGRCSKTARRPGRAVDREAVEKRFHGFRVFHRGSAGRMTRKGSKAQKPVLAKANRRWRRMVATASRALVARRRTGSSRRRPSTDPGGGWRPDSGALRAASTGSPVRPRGQQHAAKRGSSRVEQADS